MTTRVKKYISLSKSYDTANTNAEKLESGYNYNPSKAANFRKKANELMSKMNDMNLTDDESNEIDNHFECYCN